jgi:hypothetical protein
MMLDSAALLLPGIASLPPEIGSGSTFSSLVVHWEVKLSSSSVVYLKMLFSARKDGGCHALHPHLPNVFGLGPLGP